jgi:hypothetical protein
MGETQNPTVPQLNLKDVLAEALSKATTANIISAAGILGGLYYGIRTGNLDLVKDIVLFSAGYLFGTSKVAA